MHRLLGTLFLFCSLVASAGDVRLRGVAPDYAGRTASVLAIDDYLSMHKVLLGKVVIPENGNFELVFSVAETRAVVVTIGHAEADLFVSPGDDLQFQVPPITSAEFRKFGHVPIQLRFTDLPEENINLRIRDFDASYIRFINEHYYDFAVAEFRGSEAFQARQLGKGEFTDIYKRTEGADSTGATTVVDFRAVVDEFIATTHEAFGTHYSNSYFRDYVRYTLAELELLSGTPRRAIYHEYLMSQPVLHQQPAYWRLFEFFYQNTFAASSDERETDILRAVNIEKNGIHLVSLFENDSLYRHEGVRYMAVIKALRDASNDRDFTRTGLAATLHHLSVHAPDALVRSTARHVEEKIGRGRAGWKLEDFTLLDGDNERWNYYAQEELTTYFYFFGTWSPSCMKDLQLLGRLADEYHKELRIIAICLDEDHDEYVNFLRNQKNNKILFLYGGEDATIADQFVVRAVPHAVMADPQGLVMQDYTRRPSEGIGQEFENIRKRNETRSNGGTWQGKE